MLSIELPRWRYRPLSARALPLAVATAFSDGTELAATVPGNVYDDLLAAGLVADPYQGMQEPAGHWIGREDWRYVTALPDVPPGYERVDLVADGLDTCATVRLADGVVGRVADQHRSYRWDVSTLAAPGTPLSIDFESVYEVADRVRKSAGEYPAAYDEPFPYVRKMASNFGWDWGPTVVTAGIWRSIRLEAWNTARLAAVRPHASLTAPASTTGTVHVDVDLERTEARSGALLDVTVTLVAPDGRQVAQARHATLSSHVRVRLDPGEVQLWWPHDLGDQPLYRVEVELSAKDRVLGAWSGQVGFRHVSLVTTRDAVGESFGFELGGRPIFARGYNWIPADLLVTRVTADDYRERLRDAKESGANMIRVWGGGLFEQDAFYDACDELGLLVWQDCPFSCAAYPETEEFVAEIEAEMRDNVTRLMPHPSLALWNGCNENIWGHEEWGWKPVLGDRGWGAAYYFDLLPRVVSELDPGRPYWPGSPYSGSRRLAPNDPRYGCRHEWDVWNQLDYDHYADAEPRFVSEFGWCGPAAYSTLRDAIGPEHLRLWDETLMWHCKVQDPEPKLRRAISGAFHEPSGFDEWHYVMQVQQARAVGFGIDHWRRLWPLCQGALVWQLNDCWPVTSWSAVDSAGLRKPAWYAVRRAFADRIAVVGADADGYVLYLVNNTDRPWDATPQVRRVGLDGALRARWSQARVVPAGGVVAVPLSPEVAPAPGEGVEPGRGLQPDELLVVDADAAAADPGTRRVLARPDKELSYTRPEYDVETAPDAAGTRVRVTARTVVRDLLLQADRLGGHADAEPVTLLPSESHEWLVTGVDRSLSPSDFGAPVLLSAAEAELAARA